MQVQQCDNFMKNWSGRGESYNFVSIILTILDQYCASFVTFMSDPCKLQQILFLKWPLHLQQRQVIVYFFRRNVVSKM